ncbi:MAG TPA: HutD family protein [Patescibacteria group bacterium]|nr:HutD family protein [Patescibacteria group bacterium]
MNAPRLIHYRELEPVPWKNGLGLTREIALVASATNATGFRFRLSRAVIDAQAPFSKYPGVRRWLVLARGGAIELRFDGQPVRQLDRVGDLCAFSGDDVVEGVPLDGASEDFNLMLADPLLDAEVLVRPLVGSMILHQPAGSWLILHLLDGHAHLQGERATLAAGDTLWSDPGEQDRIAARIDGGGMALILRIAPRSAT